MLIRLDATTSTNDDARALALDGAPAGAAVLARRQTAGRGRDGRSWASPEGGLYLSVVLRPRAPPSRWSLLPVALGAAAARLLREAGHPVFLKWPNDLMLPSGKCGGILVEARPPAFAVAGIGLDVAAAPVPESAALAEGLDVEALARRLVDAFLGVCEKLDRGNVEALRKEVGSVWTGRGCGVAWDGKRGVALDVDEDGALVVEAADGSVVRIVAGDVRVAWPQGPSIPGTESRTSGPSDISN